MRIPKKGLTSADLERSGIPRKYWNAKFSLIPEGAPYRAAVANYLKDADSEIESGNGLYLYHSTNGTGKSGVSCVIGKRALLRGFTVYYSMCESYKSNVVRNIMFDQHQLVYDRAREVDLLILDDFGKEHKGASGWIEGELENLFRERVQAGKATILTTNMNPKNIKSTYSEDFASVLMEGCYILPIPGKEGGGKDWRKSLKLGMLTEA